MVRRTAYGDGRCSRQYLPQMQKDVDAMRKVYRKLNAEPLFDQHVLKVLNFAIDENIVTPSEVEKPRELLNRRLALLLLSHHISDLSCLPWGIRSEISKEMEGYLALHGLDADISRKWEDYAPLLRKPDGSLPLYVLALLSEKALYDETSNPAVYGVTRETSPGIRVHEDWETDKVNTAEPDMVVYRKIANLLGYRETYNRIGARALESVCAFDKLLDEVRKEKARLAPAIRRSEESARKLIAGVCEDLTKCGVRFEVEFREEKGDASMALKLFAYRGSDSPLNQNVAELNDNVAVKIRILRKPGARTENIAGVRIAEKALYDMAERLRQEGEFPFIGVRPKFYIQNPKPNGYRSDHHDFRLVTPGDPNPQFVNTEVQILTEEMDAFNRHGGAAHIAYKDGAQYEGEVGITEIKETLLGNYQRLLDDVTAMQGKDPNGSKYRPFPRSAAVPVKATVSVIVRKLDGTVENIRVALQGNDFALDVLARTGLDLRDHVVNGGKCFCDPIQPGEEVHIVQRPDGVNRSLARALYNSRTPYKEFTRNKLAELFQNGNGKKKHWYSRRP